MSKRNTSKHAATRLSSYVNAHEAHMEKLRREGFMESDDLDIESEAGHIIIAGGINCLGGLIHIEVSKRLCLLTPDREDPIVQTVAYRYHVQLRNIGPVFRYESEHPDHRRHKHKHTYDVLGGDRAGTVEDCYSDDCWPTLAEVVREAEQWFHDNVAELQERGLVQYAGG